VDGWARSDDDTTDPAGVGPAADARTPRSISRSGRFSRAWWNVGLVWRGHIDIP